MLIAAAEQSPSLNQAARKCVRLSVTGSHPGDPVQPPRRTLDLLHDPADIARRTLQQLVVLLGGQVIRECPRYKVGAERRSADEAEETVLRLLVAVSPAGD